MNEVRRNVYEIEIEEDLPEAKIKKIRRNLLELEKKIKPEDLSKPKNYYDVDIEYNGIRDVKDLFDLSIHEDYYKPIITNDAFNNNYIQYESKGDKGKNLSIKKSLNMVRPYLSDIINDRKAQGKWRIHSGNTITEHKTSIEWKI